MIITDLSDYRGENHPLYSKLHSTNATRHLDFLDSIISIASEANQHSISDVLIKSINFHAIACLHRNAGEYRKIPVHVRDYIPPHHDRVPALMGNFIDIANSNWKNAEVFELAAFVLWQINHIHPFINGNGRTARAMCYFVLRMKLGSQFPKLNGEVNFDFIELIRDQYRDQIFKALKRADASANSNKLDLDPITKLIKQAFDKSLRKSNRLK